MLSNTDASVLDAVNRLMSESPRQASTGTVRKLILKHRLSPGDVIMLTAAVRDLHQSNPGRFQTDVRTSASELWDNNPYITPLSEDDPDVEIIDCIYPLIHESNQLPYHFIHAFRLFLSSQLGVNIKPQAFKGDIYLSPEEKKWRSQVDEITGMRETPFWIIVAGGKKDFTAKWWDPDRYQDIVDHFKGKILFVQCGDGNPHHVHTPLKRVINLVGRTTIRQMVRLMYHADGVICPVTMFMHLAAAVESRAGKRVNRPAVVIAGGREPAQWEMYPHHQYLHINGGLPCCEHGGCWKSRTLPIGDGELHDNKTCLFPVLSSSGSSNVLPKCMDMITSSDVINAIDKFLQYDSFAWRTIDGYNHLLGTEKQVDID